METLPKVGLVGVGDAGMHHVRAMLQLQAENELDIACIVAREGSVQKLQSIPEVPVYDSLDEMIAWHNANSENGLNAIVVATPDRLHANHVLQCLGSGVAVLVEKPFTQTVNEAMECVDAAKANGLLLRAGYHHRFHAGHIALKESLARLGGIHKIEATWSWYDPQRNGWRSEEKTSQSWALAALGTHLIDLAGWLTQKTMTDVVAELTPKIGPEHTAHIAARLGEAEVCIRTSIDHTESSRFVINGDTGSVVCDATFGARGGGTVTVVRKDGTKKELLYAHQNPYKAQLRDFLISYRAGFCYDESLISNVQMLEDIMKARQ